MTVLRIVIPLHLTCLSMIFSENRRTLFRIMLSSYRAANCPSTSRHAGDNAAGCDARHSMMRPPPAGTPAQSARTSGPQADRATNRISRGSIGRSTSGAGAAAGAAPAAPAAGAALALAGAELLAAGAAPPPAAATAFPQAAESFALFFSRHSSAAAPPVGTPAQTLG